MVVKKGLSWLLLTRLLTQWEVLWLSDWSIGAELCVTLRTAQKHPTATILLTSLLQKDWEETQRELASHVTLAVDRGLYHTCWGRWSLAYGSLPSCHPCYRQTELESEGWVSRLCPQPSSGENHHALCTHESIFFFFFYMTVPLGTGTMPFKYFALFRCLSPRCVVGGPQPLCRTCLIMLCFSECDSHSSRRAWPTITSGQL